MGIIAPRNATNMRLKVLLFASLKDALGAANVEVPVAAFPLQVEDVRTALIHTYPQAEAQINAALMAVNAEYAFAGEWVQAGDEVSLFPPVSGGSGYPEVIELVDGPVDHDSIVVQITTPETGAVCLFSGMVRGETQQAAETYYTQALEYEAYTPMALAKMRQVAAEIRERFPRVQGIAILQRVGRANVGENTVLIACSSGHRDEGCFEAARYGIDRLKEIVPVWKKEISASGSAWIAGEYRPTTDDKAEG